MQKQQNPAAAITVPVRMDAKIFRRFAVFDTLRRQRRWVMPVVFAGILLVFAALCFASYPRDGALLLGSVLTLVALGLPGVYFGGFFHSLHQQCRAQALQTPRLVYCVRLGADLEVGNEKEGAAHYAWEKLFGVFRTDDAVYIYLLPNKAFLLPAAQIEQGADAAWALCCAALPPQKCHDMRTRRQK